MGHILNIVGLQELTDLGKGTNQEQAHNYALNRPKWMLELTMLPSATASTLQNTANWTP